MAVKNKGISINSYTVTVPATLTDGFELAFKKEVMQTILNSKYDSLKLSFCAQAVLAEAESKNYNIEFYVAKLTASK